MERAPNHISEAILVRYFEGNASQGEIAMVKAWASQSARHADELEGYRMVWQDTGVIKGFDATDQLIELDIDKAWRNVQYKKEQIDKASVSKAGYRNAALRVAATVLLAFGLGFIVYLNYFKVTETTLASADSIFDAELPDGSNVTLNKSSLITYTSEFNDESRQVKLEGEAYFDVFHKPEKPFEIDLDEVSIRVIGTEFNVLAYSDRDTIVVAVESGQVLFYSSQQEEVLTVGMTGAYDRKSGIITVRKDQIADAQHFWRTKRLSFSGTSLEEVVRSLRQVYGVPVTLANPALSDCTLTVTFEDESLEDVIDIIATTLNLQVTSTDEGIILDGEGC